MKAVSDRSVNPYTALRGGGSRIGQRWKQIGRGWELYMLLLLPVLYIILFKYVPMYGTLIAFKHFSPVQGIWGSPWAGFDHFVRFFHSPQFGMVLGNTLKLSVYGLIVGFPFPILLALSLNYVQIPFFKKLVQMATYAPHFISTVVMVGLILQFLSLRTGVVNQIISWLGYPQVDFMGKADYFLDIYVWSGLWQNLGFSCIIYLAALAGIDPSLHEAAVMDGASKWRRMWHIDLPGIMPIATILLILSVGSMLEIGFEKALLMQNALNLQASEIIDTYVYKVGLLSAGINFSYAAAIGLFKNVLNLLLLVIVNHLAKRVGQAGLW